MSSTSRLEQQMRFALEIDRLKQIQRRTLLSFDSGRRENSAEHSWHFATMAMLLQEYAPSANLNLLHVLKMVLIHDIVEIDADDTYCYDEKANLDKAEREKKAAERIFGLLPEDQARELRAIWDEFEACVTPEAKYAAALDRAQAVMLNYSTQGKSWRDHGVKLAQVLKRNTPIGDGAPLLWEYIRGLIEDAADEGWIAR